MKKLISLLCLFATPLIAAPTALDLNLPTQTLPLGARDSYSSTWKQSRILLESEKLDPAYQVALNHVFENRFLNPEGFLHLLEQKSGKDATLQTWLSMNLEDLKDFYRLIQAARLSQTEQFNEVSMRMQKRSDQLEKLTLSLPVIQSLKSRASASLAKP